MAHQIDYAAKLALFLLEESGSIFDRVVVSMCAADQRSLFGQYLGGSNITIDGANETIICRGCVVSWRDLV